MYLSTCKEALKFVLTAELEAHMADMPRPVLVGDSGVGKTSTVRQLFKEMVEEGFFDKDKAIMIEKHLGQLELGDLIGMPDRDREHGKTVWLKPCWWPDEDAEGILFLDEFGDTKNDVQRAVQQLLLEGELYEHKLPPKMLIVLAMNPVDPEFGSFSFSRQLKNRLMFWRVEPSIDEWIAYAKAKNLLPGVDRVVLSMEGGLLEKVEFEVDTGFRNPRSIVAAATLARRMTPEQSKLFGYVLFSSICGKLMAASLQSIVENSLDETMLPLPAEEILTGDLQEVEARMKKWKDSGRLELIHESVTLLKNAMRTVDNTPPILPADTANRLIRLCKCLSKDALVDLMKFLNENGHKVLVMKLSMNSDVNRILKDTFKEAAV